MGLSAVLVFVLLMTAVMHCLSAQTDGGDVAAMHALSRGLGGGEVLGWVSSSDPCSWNRVTCTDGRVAAIQIGNMSLVGTIPNEIGNLTALTRLELQYNRISGDISPIASLSSLQTLLLHDNLFSYIPISFFSGLTSLTTVYLDNNPFQTWEIPASLRNAGRLVNFSANSVNVSGSIPDFIATAFPSLNHFALAFNTLSGTIPAAFAGSSIRSLWLNNQLGPSLSGSIAFVQNMTGLEELWLHSNTFTGPLPDFSGLINLRDLQLRDNLLTGPVPTSLTSLKSLFKISLTNNLLQGPFPQFPVTLKDLDLEPASERFCLDKPGVPCDPRVQTLLSIAASFGYPVHLADNWKGNNPCDGSWLGITCGDAGSVVVINFQKMGLSGTISPEFSKLKSLQRLLLSNNNLTGNIPSSLTSLASLKELDVSGNSLDGKVPAFAKTVLLKTQGNPNLGSNVSAPTSSSFAPPSSDNVSDHGDSRSGGGGGNGKLSSSSVGVIVGSILAVVCVVPLLVFIGIYYFKRKKQRFHGVQSPHTTVIHPRHSGSDPDTVKVSLTAPNTNSGLTPNYHSQSYAGSNNTHVVEAGNMVISIQVLRNVTNNFSEANILGRGGFGSVYRGDLHDGTKIAVKRMEHSSVGSTGLHEFKSEIAVLTKVRHRNLVSLLGYCLDGNERLLVYEYMPQGTLSRHLFSWKEEGLKPLEWKKRLGVALDVARGVEYLHSLAHQSFIHRDLKPSNILLGDDMKAKVADFGLVRLADGKGCSVQTKVAGTFGYLAPEYAVTGRVTTKSDVFSFGAVLMELITGRKVLEEDQPEESVYLVTWFRRMQLTSKDSSWLNAVVDPSIIDACVKDTLASITTVAELACHCCSREPHQRPDMGHAVNVLSNLTNLWRPSDPDMEESYGIDLDMTLPQALKRWQAFEDSGETSSSSLLPGIDSTQTSIPTRPPGFAESFASVDGR